LSKQFPLARPALHAEWLILCSADVTSFFDGSLRDQLSQNVLHQILRIDANRSVGKHDQSDFLFAIAQRNLAMVNDFGRKSATIGTAIFILRVGIPQRVERSQHG